MGSLSVSATCGQLHNIFVYGSLQADELLMILLNRIPKSSLATLSGFHRFSIKGRVYPAIIPVIDKTVSGKVLFDITDTELSIFDKFEDFEYERHSVTVTLAGNVKELMTYAYVWSNKEDPYLYGDWNYEEWRKQRMEDFLKMSIEFKKGLELPSTRVSIYDSYYKENSHKGS